MANDKAKDPPPAEYEFGVTIAEMEKRRIGRACHQIQAGLEKCVQNKGYATCLTSSLANRVGDIWKALGYDVSVIPILNGHKETNLFSVSVCVPGNG